MNHMLSKRPERSHPRRGWPVLALAATLSACASLPQAMRPPAAPAAPAARVAPAAATIDLAASLRCMDNLLLEFGVRDLSATVEDASDGAQRDPGMVRDLLVTAVSDMTQRSRAIRVVSARRGGTTPAPPFTLRSTVSVQPAGAAQTRLGLGLAVLNSADRSVVPGTASRHEALLLTRGGERRVEVRHLGRALELASGGDVVTDGWRGLTQLAAIEGVGRLARVPYWTCLGLRADDSLHAEMQDWYDTMAARPAELIAWFQWQLHQRRVYDGPTDGVAHPAFRDAVTRYRALLGLSAEPKLSLSFFTAYLGADHRQLAAQIPAAPSPAPAEAGRAPSAATAVAAGGPGPAAEAPAGPLTLRVGSAGAARPLERGEPLQLSIRPSRSAHVYCFLQDENRRVSRFFPNRFQPDARVAADTGLQLPGRMRFQIVMNPRGVVETVSCFATERDVLPELPAALAAGDFQPLQVSSLDQLRSAFARVSGGKLGHDTFELRARP